MAYPPDPLSTSRSDNTPMGAGVHAGDHNDVNQAVNDIVTELGTDPSGSFADVTARLNSSLIYVLHNTTASVARPSGVALVMWIGSVQPTNAINGDVWIDTT